MNRLSVGDKDCRLWLSQQVSMALLAADFSRPCGVFVRIDP